MPSVRLQNLLVKIDRGLASRHERSRWQAAIALGELAESDPESAWGLVVSHGSRRLGDVRIAIATCVLEHLLERQFDAFFPRVAATARSSRWFRETFRSCWRMGQAELPRNAKRWQRLLRELDEKAAA